MTDREALRRKIADEEARLTQVEKERTEALARLQELKGQLAAEDSASTLLTPVPPHNLPLLHKIPHTAEEKVALFRSLFRGREDVFPKLWENAKTGRKGYAPACSNEWVGGVCRKPRIKCGSCSHRSFIPNTDQVVVDHLQGRHVIGVYPLLPDETCFFLAADFDGPSWREDVAAFVETCRRTDRVIGIPSPFFEDEQESKPWTRTPSRKPAEVPIEGLLPKEVHAVLSQRLFVQKAGLPSPLVNRIKRLAAFQNPEFYKKQKMRLSTATTPRVISCAEDLTDHVALPRGCRDDLADLLSGYGINLSMEEKRYEGEPVAFRFQGRLTAMQAEAAKALLSHDDGIFVAPPGSGKTVVGAYLTAARGRNTLVLVHRKPILDQWVARLSSFLGVEPKSIGRIGGGKNSPNGRIDVAMIQSLVRKGKVADLVAGYGHVIVDECHHLPAVSFERVFSEVSAWNVIGLTATPYRRDGHQPIIHMQLGPVRFAFSRHRSAEERTFERRLIVRETTFDVGRLGPDVGIQDIYAALAADDDRNMLIFDDVLKALEEGRSPILLTERKDHLDRLAERFRKFTRHLVVLKGGMTSREQKTVMAHLASIPDGEERLLLATGRYIGEGFDDVRLDTLFLALPVSWKGTLVQYAGRLHRQRPDKREVRIYDYVDRNVPMLARMFEKRMKGYSALGYAKTSDEEPSRSEYLPQSRQPNSPASNRHRQRPRGAAYPPEDSFSSGRLILSESIRTASEIPFEVDLVEKKPFPTGAKGPRRK